MSVFDLGGNIANGFAMGAGIAQARQQNALAQATQQDGGVVGQNTLAQMTPQQQFGWQRKQTEAAQSDQMFQADMEYKKTQIANARQKGAELARQAAAELSAEQVQAEKSEMLGLAAGAREAIQSGPEAWDMFFSKYEGPLTEQGIDPSLFTYENAPIALALVVGSLEGLEAADEYGSSLQPESGFRLATQEEAARYGSQAGQFGPDGRFYPNNPPKGHSIQVGADGAISITEGPGVTGSKPFTEGQSKDNVYSTRARGALEALEPVADSLTSRTDRAAGHVPFGFGREFQDPNFQVAEQAGNEFLMAILRKDTGAAITNQEFDIYGPVYLPQPGDSPKLLEEKRISRTRAINAIESGMSPAQMLAQERALANTAEEAGAPQPTGRGTDPRRQAQSSDLPSVADISNMSDEELDAFIEQGGAN